MIRWTNDERSKIVLYAVCLFGFEMFLGAFKFLDWGQGLARGALLAFIMLLLLALRHWPDRLVAEVNDSRGWKHVALGLVFMAAVWNISVLTLAIARTAKTGDVLSDMGQGTYRAALELWKGRSPYRQGTLLDLGTYDSRMSKRVAAGLAPTIPASLIDAELQRYWNTLDPAIRKELLPSGAPNGSVPARREASILGYKYGPVPVLVTAALAPIVGPVAVSITNGAACLALFVIIALILQKAGAGVVGGGLALCAVMIDPWITWSYLLWSATDPWPLVFGFAALLCAQCRWHVALGLCLALALGSKVLPGALYLPLLITARSTRATFAFVTGAIALFLPWMIWDAHGLFYNFLYWGALRDGDTTSWVYYTTPNIAVPVRVVIVGFVAFATYRLIFGPERRWAWAFAAINLGVVAAAPVFHNNYIPWFSSWVAIAVAEAFCRRAQWFDIREGPTGRALPCSPLRATG